MLEIKKELIEPGIGVLHLSGRIAMGRPCQEIEEQVDALLEQKVLRVILDLTDIQRVDSTGFGTIVTCWQKVKKEGGTLRIVGASGMVEEIAQSSQLPRIIAFHPDLAHALAAFGTL